MFRLPNPDEQFPTDVVVRAPSEDGWEDCSIQIHFRFRDSDRVRALVEDGDDGTFLEAVIGDWRGVCDEAGAEMPCTPANIARVASISYFARAVVDAYFARFDPGKNS